MVPRISFTHPLRNSRYCTFEFGGDAEEYKDIFMTKLRPYMYLFEETLRDVRAVLKEDI